VARAEKSIQRKEVLRKLKIIIMNVHCKYDELVEVNKLKPHPKNRNKHPEDQIDRLAKILKYQGLRAPIVVSRLSGKIVKGHGTLQAIKKNGWDKAPVVLQDFEDDDQEWLFVQSDNAIAMWAELDLKGINKDLGDLGPFDIDLIGIKDFTVTPEEKPLGDEEAVPETRATNVKLGDLFQLGNHRLLCGDSTDKASVEKLMDGKKADMVFTDPPYGINLEIGDGNGNGLAKKTDYHYIKNDNSTDCAVNSVKLCASMKIEKMLFWGANYFLECLQSTKCFICWDKRGSLPSDDFCGTEIAWTNCKKHTKSFVVEWKGMIKKGESGKRLHPNQKPVLLIEQCLDYLEAQNAILDLFGGSGSTLIACEKTNRKCFMMELDPQYCQVIIDRWEQYTGKRAVKHGKA
jgi:DNA modification methylase